jgi:hypothetical protein
MSTGGDGGGVMVGLKGYPPWKISKRPSPPPLKILPAQPAKFFKTDLIKIWGKIAKFWAKTAKFQ